MQKSVTLEADKMAQEVKVLATRLEFSPQAPPAERRTDSQELFSELHACTQQEYIRWKMTATKRTFG